VCFGVVRVGELPWKEGAFVLCRQHFGTLDAADEPPLLASHKVDLGPETSDEIDAFGAHPIGHEDCDRMSQRPSDSGERNAGVAARCLDDEVARRKQTPLMAAAYDVQGHAVFDAAGHVEIFGLAIEDALLSVEAKLHNQHGRIAYQARETIQAAFDIGDEHRKPPGARVGCRKRSRRPVR
jgi:hypothetical protein